MNIRIKPQIIKTLRERHPYSRAELAKEAGITPRQIARIESSGENYTMRDHTATKLARVLRVDLDVLKGEKPVPEKGEARDKGRTSMKLDPGLQVQFDLIEKQYGVKNRELAALAPILFTILAESTIIWHRQRNKKCDSLISDLHDVVMFETFPDENTDTAFHAMLGAANEVGFNTVDKDNLFSDSDNEWNPFAAYLQHLIRKMRDDDAKIEDGKEKTQEEWKNTIDDISSAYPGDISNLPFAVLDGLFNEITNRDSDAGEALWNGDFRIRNIPSRFFAKGQDEKRAKFLAKRRNPVDMLNELGERKSHERTTDIDDAIEKLAEEIAERKGFSPGESEEEARRILTSENIKKMAEWIAKQRGVNPLKQEEYALYLLSTDFLGNLAVMTAEQKNISQEKAEERIYQEFLGLQKGGKND